jgi:hypothetical protein
LPGKERATGSRALELIGREALAFAGIDLRPAHTLAERLGMDPPFLGDM